MEDDSHLELLSLFKKKGGYLNKSLIVKKDLINGFSVVAINDIEPNEDLINVPHNLLIPVNEVKNLKNFKNKFEEVFFKTLIANSKYLNYHPLNSNKFELEKIISVIRNNENL